MKDFYGFSAKRLDGTPQEFSEYCGRVALVVNTASKCGNTPQYAGLEALYRRYRENGLVVLGFPCNQFKGQEPGSPAEIAAFCSLNYEVDFPLFAKIEVNGPNESEIYTFLKAEAPENKGADIEWNFAKFLVDREGRVVARYLPKTQPDELTGRIEALLAA